MAKHKVKQPPTSRSSMLSQERIVDSDPDSPEEVEAESKTSTPKQPGPSRKPVEKKKASTDVKKHKTPEPESNSEAESANEEEDALEDEEASEEGSDEESGTSSSGDTKRPAPPIKAAPQRKKAKPTLPAAVAPRAFRPPNGFEKTTFSASDYATDSAEFLREDLSRKQVWHITAPASVNIKDIKPFNIQDVRSGKPIFSKNGVDYGFLTGLHKTEKLLLASGENVEYTPSMAPISGTYHLRETGKSKTKSDRDVDKENSGISFTAKSTVAPKKSREQPAGLRMRYQPYGSTAATMGRTSPSSPAVFRMAPELPESQLDKSAKKKARKENKGSHQAKMSSQEDGPMDMDPTPSSTSKNPESGKPTESASKMADKVFEAATETPSKDKKRRKKKHRITEEADL